MSIMSIQNEYLSGLMERVVRRNPAEPEFHQAVQEVLASLVPVVEAKPEYITEGVMDCRRSDHADRHRDDPGVHCPYVPAGYLCQ